MNKSVSNKTKNVEKSLEDQSRNYERHWIIDPSPRKVAYLLPFLPTVNGEHWLEGGPSAGQCLALTLGRKSPHCNILARWYVMRHVEKKEHHP